MWKNPPQPDMTAPDNHDHRLARPFYERPAEDVARDLVGTILVRRLRGRKRRARIVETEAYVGSHDLACHASKGRTKRTEVMFGRGGHAYVYLIYGMYEMFNIVTGVEGDAQAVLIRAGEPLDGWQADLSGPGKLTRALGITRADNGLDLTGDRMFLLPGTPPPQILTTRRVGIDYAQEWRDKPLRFLDPASRAVSKVRL